MRAAARLLVVCAFVAAASVPARAGEDPPEEARPPALVPLYAGFAALQSLDIHSSLAAIDNGAREANPAADVLVRHPAALMGVKAGVTIGVIYAAEKVRRRSRVGAVVLMAALNGLYAAVVIHNYRSAPRP